MTPVAAVKAGRRPSPSGASRRAAPPPHPAAGLQPRPRLRGGRDRAAPGGLVQPSLSGGSGAIAEEEYAAPRAGAGGEGGGLELVNPSCERAEGGPRRPDHSGLPGGRQARRPAALRRLLDALLAEMDLRAGAGAAAGGAARTATACPGWGRRCAALHRPPEADVAALNERRSPGAPAAGLRRAAGDAGRAGPAARPGGAREPRTPGLPSGRRRSAGAAPGVLPFPLTGAQERVLGEILDDLAAPAPHAPPAPGGRGERQDDRRRPGPGGRAGERLPGRLHGAHRAAGRAALREPRSGCWAAASRSPCSTGCSGRRRAARAALAAGEVAARGGHPRPDPGGGRVPASWGSR